MTPQEQLSVVLLPGIDGTGQMFEPLIRQLPAWMTPQVLDYPTQETLSYAELTERLYPRLPTDTPFVIVAESFAGPLALLLSKKGHPQLRALVLCATFVRNPRPWLSTLAPLVLHEGLLAQPPRRWMARWFVTGNDIADAMLDKALALHERVAPRVSLQRLQAVLNVDVRQLYRDCGLPLLHLYARHDRLIGGHPSREMQRLRPEVPSVEIDGPHFLLQARPAQCYNVIETFIRANVVPEKAG
ncbi:MAG: alpha/beta hydrolase [Gammaproteobacteria bacterium]